MNMIRKLLPSIKIALLVGLCLYTVLSSLMFVYLQLRFFDPSYFPRVLLQILTANTVFLLNLFLSLKPLVLPTYDVAHMANDRGAAFICSVIGCIMFLALALRSHMLYDWFFALCSLLVVCLSLYEILPHKQ